MADSMSKVLNVSLDSSQAQSLLDELRKEMGDKRFKRRMYTIAQRTGGHVRKIVRQDVPPKYHIKANEAASAVQGPKMVEEGGAVGCVIPIKGKRRSVGGQFSASGGAHGWNGIKKGKRIKISAWVTKGGVSVLPASMASYGGQPPFRNLSWMGLAFTRETKKRLPIRKVVGIAVPQMPMTRSRADVQSDLMKYLVKEVEANLKFEIGKRET